jgi:hypothetical protein
MAIESPYNIEVKCGPLGFVITTDECRDSLAVSEFERRLKATVATLVMIRDSVLFSAAPDQEISAWARRLGVEEQELRLALEHGRWPTPAASTVPT